MATTRPFAYNTGSTITDTEQVGQLAIGGDPLPYSENYGGVSWKNGPDEDLGYVIGYPQSGGTQPLPVSGTGYVQFWRSKIPGDDTSFINLAEYISRKYSTPQTFANANDAKIWLNSNGFWTSYDPPVTPTPTETSVIVTPTPTPTQGPTPTPTETSIIPTPTPTPTATDLSSITTYTISGCTNLNTLVVDLGPGFIVPGDVFYFTFSGATPEGCYSVVGKTNTPIEDAYLSSFGYGNCNDCEVTQVTPTPTETSVIPTPTPTETSIIPTPTPTPSVTPEPVTGYSFNLIVLPYNFPTTGNTIMNATAPTQTGTTNPNELTLNQRGIYFNSIDSDGVDRTSYFSQFTGQSITITMTQTGSTAIYSGDTNAFKYWSGNTGTPPGVPGTGFVFGTNITVPGLTAGTGNAVIIQSASTNWVTGQTVYISAVINGAGVTPTPTSTNNPTPTPTPTETSIIPTPTPTETSVPVTPTSTETPTTTPTPTPTNPTLLQMLNETTGSRTITSLTLDGITQPLSSGSYPITAGNNGFALTHGTNSNPNGVVFTFSGSGTFDLYSYLNGTLVTYLASYNNNTYTMGGTILQSSDQLLLRITDAGTLPTPTPTITPTQTTLPPTPTPTSTNNPTPTPTPTSGSTGVGWFFYSPDNQPVIDPPSNNGDTTFINTDDGVGTYNPNYTGGTLSLYFNNNDKGGTSYASQFSTLVTAGGTMTISQGSSTVIYSGTSTDYQSAGGLFTFLNVTRSAQMIQSASTPFVSGTSINVVVS